MLTISYINVQIEYICYDALASPNGKLLPDLDLVIYSRPEFHRQYEFIDLKVCRMLE